MRILVIDDDKALGAMLTEYLTAEGFEVEVAGSGEAGIDKALSGDPALVLLDVMLPGLSGIEVLGRLRQSSRIPVIMLTAKGDDVDRVVGLELGADDYIAKPFYPRELLARVRALLRRATYDGAQAAGSGLNYGRLSLFPARRRVEWNGQGVDLTMSEFNLLELLVRAKGDVVSKDVLSLKALGKVREPFERRVDIHMGHVRQKLMTASGGRAEIKTVRGVGYALATAS